MFRKLAAVLAAATLLLLAGPAIIPAQAASCRVTLTSPTSAVVLGIDTKAVPVKVSTSGCGTFQMWGAALLNGHYVLEDDYPFIAFNDNPQWDLQPSQVVKYGFSPGRTYRVEFAGVTTGSKVVDVIVAQKVTLRKATRLTVTGAREAGIVKLTGMALKADWTAGEWVRFASRPVSVQYRKDSTAAWKKVGEATSTSKAATISWSKKRAAAGDYRLVFSATTTYGGSTSDVVTVA